MWTDDNTREGIWNGMLSKETYGTSGTLIRLRFFGSWDMPEGITEDPKFVEKAYAAGKLPPVGNTVNIKKASYTNDIGDSQLTAQWTDPDFDPTNSAAYYVRVLEIPTPRWSTYDAAKLGIEPPKDVVPTIQERLEAAPAASDHVESTNLPTRWGEEK